MKACALCLLILASAVAVNAQGTVNFINAMANGVVNAPVYQSDGVTKCSGSQFMAELLEGPTAGNLVSVAMTGFLTGNAAGYFNGGAVTLNNVSAGISVWVQVDVWNTASGTSFDQARASALPNSWWQSSPFTIVTGGGFFQPTPPATLTGLGTSPVYLNSVPEPSIAALVGLGMALVSSCSVLNKLMKTNRRYKATLKPLDKCERSVSARRLLPAAFAYRVRLSPP